LDAKPVLRVQPAFGFPKCGAVHSHVVCDSHKSALFVRLFTLKIDQVLNICIRNHI